MKFSHGWRLRTAPAFTWGLWWVLRVLIEQVCPCNVCLQGDGDWELEFTATVGRAYRYGG